MIKEIKTIPLAAFLSQLGHEPAARKGTRLWYKSPLRQERTPSFKVETTLNCWYDFGIGRGGNIIDLATELYQSTDLRYLMRCIANSYPVPSVQTVASSFPQRHSAPSVEQFEVVPLEHRALVAYLQKRGIPAHIAKSKCKEAHYSFNGSSQSAFVAERRKKSYFAVAFERSSTMAGNCATNISKVAGDARTSHICRGREMARQQSVPCSRDLLIISLPLHSASSAEPTQSFSTRLSLSTRLCRTPQSTAILTTTMPEKQHSPS